MASECFTETLYFNYISPKFHILDFSILSQSEVPKKAPTLSRCEAAWTGAMPSSTFISFTLDILGLESLLNDMAFISVVGAWDWTGYYITLQRRLKDSTIIVVTRTNKLKLSITAMFSWVAHDCREYVKDCTLIRWMTLHSDISI